MRIRLLLICSLLCAGALMHPRFVSAQQASGYTPLPPIQLPPELDRVLRDYERAWRAGDEKALSELFAPDGFVPSREGWVRGASDIQRAYRDGSGPLALSALDYAVQDTVGYIVGTFGYGSGGQHGKFILALRRSPGGRWLIAADLDG
jgi:hypothetical protein